MAPRRNTNQKLANAAYATVVKSGQYNHGNKSTFKKALELAKAGHTRAHIKGPGPNSSHVTGAALNWELKHYNY
jgi:hypothetical protein